MKKNLIFTLILLLILTLKVNAQTEQLKYETLNQNTKIKFNYPDTLNNSYLSQLRKDYSLDKLVENKKQDLDIVLTILNWTNAQWKHNGSNEPSKSDALTILHEAKEGKQFRCVEYGIVSTTALQSLNYKARVLSVKTKNAETTQFGAGHVLGEVWMPQFNKWVLIDGQFNIMPILDNIPLNAVEFQNAIRENKNYKLIDINGEVSKKRRKNYLSFIYDYLFYFDVKFDNRIVTKENLTRYENKTSLMLVPIGVKNPIVFQITHPIDYAFYTNSLKDFYQSPFQE